MINRVQYSTVQYNTVKIIYDNNSVIEPYYYNGAYNISLQFRK